MFNPNRNSLPPMKGGKKKPSEPMKPAVKRRLWVTFGLTALLLLIWIGGIALGEELQTMLIAEVLMIVYGLAFAVVLIAYLVYNRAFVNKNVTVDMLPAEWSEERKEAFLEDNRRRADRSRWMVTLIIPLATVILVEFIYLFWWDSLIAPLLA